MPFSQTFTDSVVTSRGLPSVDTDSEDDPTLFEWFPAEDTRRRSDHLMNLGLERLMVTRVRCLQARKRIRVDVPNKSALWMSWLSQCVRNICAAELIILLVKNIDKY